MSRPLGPRPPLAVRVAPRASEGTSRYVRVPVPQSAGAWVGALAVVGIGAAAVAVLALGALAVVVASVAAVAAIAALVSRSHSPSPREENSDDHCW